MKKPLAGLILGGLGVASLYMSSYLMRVPLAMMLGALTGLSFLYLAYGVIKGYRWGFYGGVAVFSVLSVIGLLLLPTMAPEGLLLLAISAPTLAYMLWSRRPREEGTHRQEEGEQVSEEDLLF